MNIPKAIDILQDILAHVEPGDPPEEHDAIQLAIDALIRIKKHRDYSLAFNSVPLPGETVL